MKNRMLNKSRGTRRLFILAVIAAGAFVLQVPMTVEAASGTKIVKGVKGSQSTHRAPSTQRQTPGTTSTDPHGTRRHGVNYGKSPLPASATATPGGVPQAPRNTKRDGVNYGKSPLQQRKTAAPSTSASPASRTQADADKRKARAYPSSPVTAGTPPGLVPRRGQSVPAAAKNPSGKPGILKYPKNADGSALKSNQKKSVHFGGEAVREFDKDKPIKSK